MNSPVPPDVVEAREATTVFLKFASAFLVVAFSGLALSQAQTARSELPSVFPIGPYGLDASIENLKGLKEFSSADYAVMGRQFEGEIDYNAPQVKFLGRQWNLQLGTVHGKIYKIAPYLVFENHREGSETAQELLRYCNDKLGNPAQKKSQPGPAGGHTDLFLWDTQNGNAVFQTGEVGGTFSVSLYLTSNSVRQFKPR